MAIVPVQPLAVGVIVIVTVPGMVSEFVSVIAGIVLVPLAVKPVIPVLATAVQAKVVPGTAEVRVTEVVD